MKSLRTIQVLSKLGKIFSKIVFICSIVGFCICIAGIIGLATGVESLKIGSFTLKSFLNTEAGLEVSALYAASVCVMILCVGEAVLAKFAEHYFRRELADGTPFHTEGANEMRRLGILTICIPLGTQIIAEIVRAAMLHGTSSAASLRIEGVSSVSLGVLFIILSVICRYGAEILEEKHAAVK